MAREIRIDQILIRFDENGELKGAAAYDYEQERDDSTGAVTPLRELQPRPIDAADVASILTSAELDLANKNVQLQAELVIASRQRDVEMSGRARDAEAHRAAVAARVDEISRLRERVAELVAPPPGPSVEARLAAIEARVAEQESK
jgi:outer membrane PBP1 activator LpoA protein